MDTSHGCVGGNLIASSIRESQQASWRNEAGEVATRPGYPLPTLCFDIPVFSAKLIPACGRSQRTRCGARGWRRARTECVCRGAGLRAGEVEPGRIPDGWTTQLLKVGAHIAALLLEVERAQARSVFRVKPAGDGAAPLIGSSRPIKALRERIERVAAFDFTVLIEGASGPQPHPNFIEVSGEPALGGGEGEVAGAGRIEPR